MFFFQHKRKNILLYQTSEREPSASLALHPLQSPSFPKIFSAWKLGGIFFCFLFLGGALAYGLFFSTEFQIQSVQVQGASSNDAAAIISIARNGMQQKIAYIVPKSSYFLFPTAEIQEMLRADFPRLSSIIISRPNPNSAVISVAQRSIVGIWCAGEEAFTASHDQKTASQQRQNQAPAVIPTQGPCAFFDKEGIIFDEAPDAISGHLFFVVRDARIQTMPPLGTHVLDNTMYTFLQNLRNALADTERIPASFMIKNGQEVDVNFLEVNHAWSAYFSTVYSAAYQASILTRLISDTIGKNFPYLDYVDLRVENKAYYSVHPAK